MITVIDNYDSFTWNLVQLIESVAAERVSVVRNDAFELDALLKGRPRALVISPGPGTPAKAGKVLALIRANGSIPLLGVCLGHQALGEAMGGRVIRGAVPVHGKVNAVLHQGRRLFADCPSPMMASRYHSLILDRASLPADLIVDAETEDGTIMAISHRTKPFFGLQFHPESFGTVGGGQLIRNFLKVTQ